VLAVFLAMTPAVLGQSKKDKDQAEKFTKEAHAAMSAKKYAEAIDLYGKSLALVSNNGFVRYRKAFAHFNLDQFDPAVTELTLALEQKHTPIEVYRLRYYIYAQQQKFDAALDDLEKALAITPKDVTLMTAKGEYLYAKKSYPQALEAFREAAKMAPEKGDIHYGLARVALGMGDSKLQAEEAQVALDKGTTFPGEVFFLLADAQQKLKNNAAAIEAYKRVVPLKPKMFQVYMSLSDLYKAESRFNDSIDILKKAMEQFPADGRIYTELGLIYSLAGRPADAVAAARSGVGAFPNDPQGYTNLCRALNETQEYAQAVSACRNSLRIRPDDGETNFYLGNALIGTNKGTEAAKAYADAVRGLAAATAKDPGQSDLWYLLGNAYFSDKQIDKAIEAYLKCLALSPKYNRARVNLGIAYTRKKNKPAATEQYNLLLAVDAGLAARVKTEIDKM
jgi:tetratricopeptide (TPR) repeat protein